jgi:deoxyribodipyrimidine photo-lyase
LAKQHSIAICWFRRGIRVDDNLALTAAVTEAEQIVPVFVLDPAILSRPDTGAVRTRFLFDSLRGLDQSLRQRGGRLIVRYGKPVEALQQLVIETGATGLYFSADYEPYSRERDGTIGQQIQGIRVVREFHDHVLSVPGTILAKSTGKPYTVYTPFKKVWFGTDFLQPIPAPERVLVPDSVWSEPLPENPSDFGVPDANPFVLPAGEAEARQRMHDFVRRTPGGVRNYETDRELPGVEGTSRLSAYLRMGVLSPRRLLAEVVRQREQDTEAERKGYEIFLSELAWRDFYYQILWHFPYVADSAFKPEYSAIQWENNETYFAAWCAGQTGYPIVDAAMRQLNAEAWMHNRARMIVSSFLTKDLLIDWRWGERYFMQKLVDGDMAANNGGWQWAAGTGTDAQPYFRIFNPVSQGEKFDPDGTYVKHWVPELAKLPKEVVHQPWKLSVTEQEVVKCRLGRDYPYPIVDHAVQREQALALYRRVAKGKANEDKQ